MSSGVTAWMIPRMRRRATLRQVRRLSWERRFPEGLLNSRRRARPHRTALTPREREILVYFADGCTCNETARKLWLSPATVRFHRANILLRLDARNMPHAVALAYERKLLGAVAEHPLGVQDSAASKLRPLRPSASSPRKTPRTRRSTIACP